MTKAGEYYRRLARNLDTPEPAPPLPRPRPKPDPALFPRDSQRHGDRDPGARSLLDLRAPHPQARRARCHRGDAERRRARHDHSRCAGDFAEQYPKALPAHAQEILLALGADAFAEIAEAYPELYAEWWPRFTRLATEFVVWEQNAPRRSRGDLRGALRTPVDPAARRHDLQSARPRRPYRAPARRRLHHRRLQDRPAARREGGLCRLLAAADPRGR